MGSGPSSEKQAANGGFARILAVKLECRNGGKWHNVRAQLGALEGTKTASLPPFARECRLSGGNDTRIPKGASAYS